MCSDVSDVSNSDPENEMINEIVPSRCHSPYAFYKLDLSTFKGERDEHEKRALIIAAVVQNNVNFLREKLINNWNVLDYYEARNENDGNNLLQIAIIHRNREMFDFILSLKDLPLEHVNFEGETALTLTLNGTGEFYDYVACELVKKGASLQNFYFEGAESLLHISVGRSFVKLTKLLLEMGSKVDELNQFGLSPLWCCLDSGAPEEIESELIAALLSYGADPTIGKIYGYNMYEFAVKFSSAAVIEQLFYYYFDEYTKMDLHLEILLTLAEEKSLFYETLKHTERVILDFSSYSYYYLLLLIDVESLKKLLDKCSDVIKQILIQVRPDDYRLSGLCDKFSFDNFNVLLESDLRCDVINFIADLSDKFYFNFLIGWGCEERIVLERLCFLLSHGLRISESHLQLFYKKFGYSEIVKILLHMDIEVNLCKRSITDVALLFIYEVTLDLEKYLENPNSYTVENVHELLNYFAHPKLKNLCGHLIGDKRGSRFTNQPEIPFLVELSRNAFRKFFVQKFNITKAKEFYSLLNELPISLVHKKIITFETKLY